MQRPVEYNAVGGRFGPIYKYSEEDWAPVAMSDARFLRSTTERSDIALIARDITSKRVVGEGIHFDMIADTDDSQNAMRDMASSSSSKMPGEDTDDDDYGTSATASADAKPPTTSGQHLLRHANKRRFNRPKRASEGTDSIPLDDIFAAVRVEWNELVERLDEEILRQGFALVVAAPSRHHPDILVPRVEDIDYYQLWQRYVPLVGREYLATWDNLSQNQQAMLAVRNDDIIQGAKILVAVGSYAPDSSGELQSKMSIAAPLIAELEAMEENISYGLYWATHPPWVPLLGPTGAGSAKATASAAAAASSAPPYANYTQLLQDKSALSRFARAQKKDDHEEDHDEAYSRHRKYQLGQLRETIEAIKRTGTHTSTRARSASEGNMRHALNPPYMNEYPMESGDTVSSGPDPKLPTQTRDNKNDVARRAYLALGVQPQLVSLEHANHAANSDIAFAGQNEAILNRQRTLEPLLAEAFRFVYAVDLDGVETMLSSTKIEPPSKATDASSSSSAVAHAGSAVRTRVCDPEGNASRVAHRIRARLTCDPLTTPTCLENMLKTHVIDHATYKELMLKSACVSTHLSSADKVTFEQVDTWYNNAPKDKESSPAGTKKEINGKSKKRTAASRDD